MTLTFTVYEVYKGQNTEKVTFPKLEVYVSAGPKINSKNK